jgi:hypothetical protein
MVNKSILFSSVDADKINNLISTHIDARLYLFAYYLPKQLPNEDNILRFWIGVINLYTLFYDCSPFLFRSQYVNNIKYKDLLYEFVHEGLLQYSEETDIRKFIKLIHLLRTLFCHNATIEDYGNRDKRNEAVSFFSQFSQTVDPNIKNIDELCLSNAEWNDALIELHNMAELCMTKIKNSLAKLISYSQTQKVINKWLYLLIGWYQQENMVFIKSTIADYYELNMISRGHSPPFKNMKNCIRKWEDSYKQKWINDIERTVLNMNTQVFPYNVLMNIIKNETGLKFF